MALGIKRGNAVRIVAQPVLDLAHHHQRGRLAVDEVLQMLHLLLVAQHGDPDVEQRQHCDGDPPHPRDGWARRQQASLAHGRRQINRQYCAAVVERSDMTGRNVCRAQRLGDGRCARQRQRADANVNGPVGLARASHAGAQHDLIGGDGHDTVGIERDHRSDFGLGHARQLQRAQQTPVTVDHQRIDIARCGDDHSAVAIKPVERREPPSAACQTGR